MLEDIWGFINPMIDKIKKFIKKKFSEDYDKSLAVVTAIGVGISLWLGGYIVTNAVMGAISLTAGILILCKYLPHSWKLFIAKSKGCQAIIDISAGILALTVFTGVTGLFAGVYSTIMVTATLGLMTKYWTNELDPELEPINA